MGPPTVSGGLQEEELLEAAIIDKINARRISLCYLCIAHHGEFEKMHTWNRLNSRSHKSHNCMLINDGCGDYIFQEFITNA